MDADSNPGQRPRFHLAIPVTDLEQARDFYAQQLGCATGRESSRWIDFDFFGHQLVTHLVDDADHPGVATNDVSGITTAVEEYVGRHRDGKSTMADMREVLQSKHDVSARSMQGLWRAQLVKMVHRVATLGTMEVEGEEEGVAEPSPDEASFVANVAGGGLDSDEDGAGEEGPEETAEEKTERKRRAAAVAEEALAEIEEAEEETAEPAELTASDLLAEAEADAAAAQGIPEPSVERWDAEGRFGVAGRPELQ